jgi:hypothetical protein
MGTFHSNTFPQPPILSRYPAVAVAGVAAVTGAGAFAFLVVIPEGDLLLLLMLSCLAPAVLVVIPEEPALSEIEWGICCYV